MAVIIDRLAVWQRDIDGCELELEGCDDGRDSRWETGRRPRSFIYKSCPLLCWLSMINICCLYSGHPQCMIQPVPTQTAEVQVTTTANVRSLLVSTEHIPSA